MKKQILVMWASSFTNECDHLGPYETMEEAEKAQARLESLHPHRNYSISDQH